jgi:hypothetical protein
VGNIDVFSIHDVLISQIVLFFNDMEDKPNIPLFSPPGGGDEPGELSSMSVVD